MNISAVMDAMYETGKDAAAEQVAELLSVLERCHAAMGIMHPDAEDGITDAEFASLWSATEALLFDTLKKHKWAKP